MTKHKAPSLFVRRFPLPWTALDPWQIVTGCYLLLRHGCECPQPDDPSDPLYRTIHLSSREHLVPRQLFGSVDHVGCGHSIPTSTTHPPRTGVCLGCKYTKSNSSSSHRNSRNSHGHFEGRPNFPVTSRCFLTKIRPFSRRRRPNFLVKAAKLIFRYEKLPFGHRQEIKKIEKAYDGRFAR